MVRLANEAWRRTIGQGCSAALLIGVKPFSTGCEDRRANIPLGVENLLLRMPQTSSLLGHTLRWDTLDMMLRLIG